MRVAVIGSRRLCLDIAPYIPKETTEIITYEVPGVCMLASAYADSRGLPKLIVKASYIRAMRRGRKWRGSIVLDEADMVVALWNGKSIGTGHAIEYARVAGKPLKVHLIKE